MEKPVRRMHKHSRLPRTSRVNDKIVEYYTKFGKDRDLEKFMRLYSPASSQNSQNSEIPIQTVSTLAITSSNSSCCVSEDGATLRRLFRESAHEFNVIASRSLPNMEVESNEINVPIRLTGGSDKQDETDQSTSTECAETPEKSSQAQCKETQTPESVIKTHKRLEWDSMGDVGYNKSMSTSNISLFERTLLKELFQDSPATATALSKEVHTNASESDLYNLRQDTIGKSVEHNTPPLASSTFAETKRGMYMGGARPKCTNRSTCTSLRKQFEKSSQTTLPHRDEVTSREVQVNMASTTSSLIGSTATPSSFEYYSSRSSCSTKTSNDSACPDSHQVPQCPLRPSKKVSAKRSLGSEEADAVKLQEMHDTLKQAFIENKENNSASGLLNSPQLDLGIELLCSLIDAKSLNNKQKKQLIKNIVKRISLMSISNSDDALSNISNILSDHSIQRASTRSDAFFFKSSAPSENKHGQACEIPRRKDGTEVCKFQYRPQPLKETTRTSSSSGKERPSSKDVEKKSSPPETSARALAKLAELNATKTLELEQQHARDVSKSMTAKDKNSKKPEKYDKELQIDIPQQPAIPAAKKTASSSASRELTTLKTSKGDNNEKAEKCDKELQTAVEHATSNSPITPIATVNENFPARTSTKTSSSLSSSSSSGDITTQKALNELKSAKSTDGEQATMRDWLNPLTQSEIDYEERKRASAEIADRQMKKIYLRDKEKHKANKERDVQLDWIDTEIKRLESLRYLLLKDNDVSNDEHKEKSGRSRNEDKLYDTVYVSSSSSSTASSSSSVVRSGNTKRVVQEIEVIIEESNEDVVDLKEQSKRKKERKRETQIYFDKPQVVGEPRNARFRKIKETIITNEEQIIQADDVPPQRSKIDTPVPPQESTDNESVRSFAQHRKDEFLTHYKHKRKTHLEALQQLKQLENKEKRSTESSNETPAAAELKSSSSHISYNISADCTWVSHTRTTYHPEAPKSTSSLLGLSSDMSVPMVHGSSSSTSTTTHQYDDVAAAVQCIGAGVQTSNSLLCTHPIFGPLQVPQPTRKCHTEVQPACVQVRPKGIAYVIQFDESLKSKSSSTSSSSTHKGDPNGKHRSGSGNVLPEEQPIRPYLTLQDHLERGNPEFMIHSKERKAILNQIQALRLEREREMRYIIENASMTSVDDHLTALPPPPTTQVRVFGTREMKALTHKYFERLPEVRAKQLREREERRRRGNRVMRDVFNQRLQRRVRNGQLSLNHSKTVI